MPSEKFNEGAQEAQSESFLQEVFHSVGDMASDIVAGKGLASEEAREREAGYHKTKKGEYVPPRETKKDEVSDESSRASDRDTYGYGGQTARGNAVSGPTRTEAPEIAWGQVIGAFLWYPILFGFMMWGVFGFVGCTIRAGNMESPTLNGPRGAAVSYQEEANMGFGVGFLAGLVFASWSTRRNW